MSARRPRGNPDQLPLPLGDLAAYLARTAYG